MVVCNGGGGIPVVRAADNSLQGIEAVIDKDLSSAFLANKIGADVLLLLTDVDAVYQDFATPEARPLHTLTVAQCDEMNVLQARWGQKSMPHAALPSRVDLVRLVV